MRLDHRPACCRSASACSGASFSPYSSNRTYRAPRPLPGPLLGGVQMV